MSILESFEVYIRTGRRLLCAIDNRYTYIQKLRRNHDARLDIFKDTSSVEDLVTKQVEARDMARCAIPGWQDAMKEAGTWDDDDNECPEHSASGYRAKPDVSEVIKLYR